jgi:hypothetical protein
MLGARTPDLAIEIKSGETTSQTGKCLLHGLCLFRTYIRKPVKAEKMEVLQTQFPDVLNRASKGGMAFHARFVVESVFRGAKNAKNQGLKKHGNALSKRQNQRKRYKPREAQGQLLLNAVGRQFRLCRGTLRFRAAEKAPCCPDAVFLAAPGPFQSGPVSSENLALVFGFSNPNSALEIRFERLTGKNSVLFI